MSIRTITADMLTLTTITTIRAATRIITAIITMRMVGASSPYAPIPACPATSCWPVCSG